MDFIDATDSSESSKKQENLANNKETQSFFLILFKNTDNYHRSQFFFQSLDIISIIRNSFSNFLFYSR